MITRLDGPSSESKSCRPRKLGQSSKWSYSQRRDNFLRSMPKFLDPAKLPRNYDSVLRAIPVTGSWTLLCNKILQTTSSPVQYSSKTRLLTDSSEFFASFSSSINTQATDASARAICGWLIFSIKRIKWCDKYSFIIIN